MYFYSLHREIIDKKTDTEAIDQLRQLLPLTKSHIEVVTVNPLSADKACPRYYGSNNKPVFSSGTLYHLDHFMLPCIMQEQR